MPPNPSVVAAAPPLPSVRAVVELLKPITWFPPMWALGCGAVAAGASSFEHWLLAAAGVALAGPLVCGTSQAVNDWFDREVDAINEAHRPIPSGRLPGTTGLYVAVICTAASMAFALYLGPWASAAAALGLLLAWAYSAPPLRLKRNGWLGNATVALSYEGLPWFTGAALIAGGLPDGRTIVIALLYSAGAHGIMTLNDFKSVAGDRATGIRSLPAELGIETAARLACVVMAVAQIAVAAFLAYWGSAVHAAVIFALLLVQIALMARLLGDPRGLAPWYNATGVTLYVSGMMVAAFALRPAAEVLG